MVLAASAAQKRFLSARRLVFGIALASFVLSFFHRTAPVAIAGELTQRVRDQRRGAGHARRDVFLRLHAAADSRRRARRHAGAAADPRRPARSIAGAGSLAFALAPTWEIAAAGRTLVGVGVSVAFIAILKLSAVWFPANRFATLNGVTMFAGNLGAVIAGAPLAWIVTQTSWRTVFVGLAGLSIALGVATWSMVRDRPEAAGICAGACAGASGCGRARALAHALGRVLANPATWPGFFVNVGIGGSYLAFAGLWAVPYLERNVWIATRHGRAAREPAAARRRLRRDRCRRRLRPARQPARRDARLCLSVCAVVAAVDRCTCSGRSRRRSRGSSLMGSLIPGFTLSWTVAKEVNRRAHSGIATSRRQPRHLSRHRHSAAARRPDARSRARSRRRRGRVGSRDCLLAGVSAFGALMTLFVRDTEASRVSRCA